MIAKNQSPNELRTRESVANSVNRVMMRFSAIIEILDNLNRVEVPHPGDDDIRHGCQRALTAMLSELARIQPAPEGKISKAERIARAHLQIKYMEHLVDPDLLQRFEQFITRIFGVQISGSKTV